MAAEAFTMPARATDLNNRVYAGAKLYFYDKGTLTPRAVYSDSLLTTSLGAVVTADSAGWFPETYFDAAHQYRCICKSADGSVTIFDRNQINSGLLSLVTEGNAVTSNSVSVLTFGAVGDGTTDDTTALSEAITYAIANKVTIDLGGGKTYMTTGLTVTGDLDGRTLFKGSGAVLYSTIAAPIINLSTASYLTIDGVSFLGNTGSSDTAQRGIKASGTSDIIIRNCHFENLSVGFDAYNTLTTGYPLTGAFQRPSSFVHNTIKNCRIGVWTLDQSGGNYGEYWRIESNLVTDCARAGMLIEAGNTVVTSNTCNGNLIGLWLAGSAAVNGDHGQIIANTCNHNSACGIYVDQPLRGWIITGNNVWANLGGLAGTTTLASVTGVADGSQAWAFGMFIRKGLGLTITGNDISRNQVNLGVNELNSSIITGNQFKCASGGGLYGTVGNTKTFNEFDVSKTYGNKLGGNLYASTWTDTTNFPTNGAWDRVLAPTYTNGWVDFGGGYRPGGYWKDVNGVVHLQGLIKTGTLGVAAFTIPWVPEDGLPCSHATVSNDVFGQVQVQSDGRIIPLNPSSNVWVSLEGICYRAAT